MVLCRLEAVTVLKQLMGDPSVHMARATRPGSLRARFGRDGQRNALHGSESLKVPPGRERKWVASVVNHFIQGRQSTCFFSLYINAEKT